MIESIIIAFGIMIALTLIISVAAVWLAADAKSTAEESAIIVDDHVDFTHKHG